MNNVRSFDSFSDEELMAHICSKSVNALMSFTNDTAAG